MLRFMKLLAGWLAKRVAVSAIALVVLLAPACQGLCWSRSCDFAQTSPGSSDCHATAPGQNEPQGLAVSAVPNCGLRELSAALPANWREIKLRRQAVKFELFSGSVLFLAGARRRVSSMSFTEGIRLNLDVSQNRHTVVLSTVLRL